MSDPPPALAPGDTVGFVGLGRMGNPMAARLAAAGYRVTGFDVSAAARTEWASAVTAAPGGATAAGALAGVAAGASAVVLMLPDSAAVTSVLTEAGLLESLPAGSVVVDMSSSAPAQTRALAQTAARRGVGLVDAPVSGGVRGARRGDLTIMVGGSAADVPRVRGLLGVLGSRVLHVGGPGAGHAVKALNNLMSATHLLVTSEAMVAAARFGLDLPVVLDAVNGSSGRSGSTENKWPNFIVPRSFDSGFPLRLMRKDVLIALDLIESAGGPAPLSAACARLWDEAARALAADADHTEIACWLDPGLRPSTPREDARHEPGQ